MDERPDPESLDPDATGGGAAGDDKKRIWDGELDESDGEDDKPSRNESNANANNGSEDSKEKGVGGAKGEDVDMADQNGRDERASAKG